jgi:glycerol-3-phosphate acyltransferase PlsY
MPEGAAFSAAAILAAPAMGYLLGSVPFGLILTRLAGLGDVRRIGSGNIGATNVLRTGNKALAAATLAGDLLKGAAAVWIAWRWGEAAAILGGAGAVLGHVFPLWLRFKGGKGVATFLGVLLGLAWPLALAFAAAWIAVALLTRYSSLSALTAAALVPFLALPLEGASMAAALAALAALLFWTHRENIRRLREGRESKMNLRGAG